MRLSLPLAAFLASTALTACGPVPKAEVSKGLAYDRIAAPGLPAMPSFAGGPAVGATRSNTAMAADFLDLSFRMESGRTLPVLTRFEGPITVALTGDVPPSAAPELARLIARFRAEAGLDIRQTTGPAAITIDFQPKSALRRAVPSAACFVVPGVRSLQDYSAARRSAAVDWARLQRRDKVAVIAPSDSSPQELRDCLHEELAQAMGPLNDLFRLPDSVFNDDNFHSVLTGFDMLMLRVHYAPELRSGMTQAEVAARLPAILARLNPRGAGIAGTPGQISPRAWVSAAEAAFGARGSTTASQTAAARMIGVAQAQGWTDGRLAFSHFAKGRALTGTDAAGAIAAYTRAAQIWRNQPGAQIHTAHVDMQLSAFALSSGQFTRVLSLTDRAIPVARSHQNAALLASLLAMQAEALEATGRQTAAQKARLDSLAWARYAFGSEALARVRLSDIRALANRGTRG
ncbi:MAG: DUF2927 domain-containing protein [Rhodobacteraceae bacterium]|nr:DUF2927 domain-containing protein [Paracoccaceae bacterium]